MHKTAQEIIQEMSAKDELIQKALHDKMLSEAFLTEDEVDLYKLTTEDAEINKLANRLFDGEEIPGFTFKDFLGTPQAKVLVPKIVIVTMKKSAEPIYLA